VTGNMKLYCNEKLKSHSFYDTLLEVSKGRGSIKHPCLYGLLS
jgi:hypothetical protein